ncbi:MAG: preprotein translocase subunit SecG [Hyphomonadaceae bacterium]
MELIVLLIHLVVCICLIGLVLLQRSEGGALGMGGGGGGSLMSGRGAADALARMTSVAGGFFLVTSLGLTFLSGASASSQGGSVFDRLPQNQSAPATTPSLLPPPAETAPDPTESSAPEAAETQLASAVTPGPAQASAAPATRAAPLDARPTTTTTTPQRSGATTVATSAPATQSTTRPTQRSTTPTTQPSQPAPQPTRVQIPNTSGAVTGIALEDTQTGPESSDTGAVEAVRRERAGPDQ